MKKMRKLLSLLAISALTAGGVALYAQPAPGPMPAESDADIPMSKEAQLSPDEMSSRAREHAAQSDGDLRRIEQLKAEARKKKDIIKLNCLNDKLLQAKQLLNIIDDATASLTAAISTGNEGDRYHRYTVITISVEKVRVVREEAEACVGEEISYLGPSEIDVDEPDLPDDPTDDGPWDSDQPGDIDEPGYASPFL